MEKRQTQVRIYKTGTTIDSRGRKREQKNIGKGKHGLRVWETKKGKTEIQET